MNTQMGTLRTYQATAVRLILDELGHSRRAHAALPTGSGKSRVLVEVARDVLDRAATTTVTVADGSVLVVSPRRQITGQLTDAMRATGHEAVSLPAPGSAPVMVGTALSLKRWVKRTGSRPLLVLVDEAHHATAEGCRALLDAVPDALRVGVTATPYRHDGQRLDDVLGQCVMVREPGHPDMADVLAPVVWRPVRLPIDLEKVPVTSTADGRDYQVGSLGTQLSTPEAVAATVRGTASALVGRLVLVFAVNLAHARLLADAYRREGLRVGCVFGTTPTHERADLIDRLSRGLVDADGLDMLVTVGALTEGFDCPAVSALVIARPTRSELLYVQMMGRGLRVSQGKSDCVVLDVTGRDSDAGPTATGQVFAPTVIPSVRSMVSKDRATEDSAAVDLDRDDGTWWANTSRPMIGTDRRSPRWAWSKGPDGTLMVPLAEGHIGVLHPTKTPACGCRPLSAPTAPQPCLVRFRPGMPLICSSAGNRPG